MLCKSIAAAALAVLLVTAAGHAGQRQLNASEKDDAARALDQRVGCAAFYRVTFDLLTGRRANERTRALAADYDAAGRNLLVQARELAGALGEADDMLHVRFKAALAALDEEIDGQAVAYNRFAARLDPVCRRLIRK